MIEKEVSVRQEDGVVVAQSGGIKILVDTEGRILTPRSELDHHSYINDAETEVAMDIIREKRPTPCVPIEVYFKHVRANLKPIDEIRLQPYMERLSRVAKHMKSLGQIGGYEAACKKLLQAAREIEMKVNHGVEFSVERHAVEDFIHYTQDKSGGWLDRKPAPVRMKRFKDFPRLIPKHIEGIVKEFHEKGIFDDFEIVYIDRSGQGDEVGESAETARSKDPILFGVLNIDRDKLYYITAWDDEHCDMTFDEMVENANFEEGDFTNIPEADELTEEYILKLEEEVLKTNKSRFNPISASVKMPEEDPKTGRTPSRVWERIKANFKFGRK